MYVPIFQNQHHVPCQWREKSHFTRPVTTTWCENACFHAARRLGLAGKSKRFMTSEANKLARLPIRTGWTSGLKTHLCKAYCMWRNSGRVWGITSFIFEIFSLFICLIKISWILRLFNFYYFIERFPIKFLTIQTFNSTQIQYPQLNTEYSSSSNRCTGTPIMQYHTQETERQASRARVSTIN